MSFAKDYLSETAEILAVVDTNAIEKIVDVLVDIRNRQGRLFVLGVGGSASNASHAVNDFRKIAGIEAYTPTDNVAELTARINDDGWNTSLAGWLDVSHITETDGILVFSVGGGMDGVSTNIVAALDLAIEVDASIIGIVGRTGGYTSAVATACVIIPPLFFDRITPHTEGVAMVVHHLLVSHPRLAR